MSGAIQNLVDTISGINRGTLVQWGTQWKGRGIELLTNLSARMHQSPFKAFAVILTANALFYTLFSRVIINLFNQPGQVERNRLRDVMALSVLTPLFNLGFSKLLQFQLSRTALLAITSTVIILRLLFKNESGSTEIRNTQQGQSTPAISPKPTSIPTKPTPAIPPNPMTSTTPTKSTVEPLTSLSFNFSDPDAQALKSFGFTEDQLTTLFEAVNAEEASGIAYAFHAFCYECSMNHFLLFSLDTDEKRNTLIQDMITRFNKIKNDFVDDSIGAFCRISGDLRIRELNANYSYLKRLNFVNDQNYNSLIGMGFSEQQLAIFAKTVIGADWTVEGTALFNWLMTQVRDLGQKDLWTQENKTLFLDHVISEFAARAKTRPSANGVMADLEEIVLAAQQRLSEYTDDASSGGINRNHPAYQRLLILGFSDRHLVELHQEIGANEDSTLEALDGWMGKFPSLNVKSSIAKMNLAKKVRSRKEDVDSVGKQPLELLRDVLETQLHKHKFIDLNYTETDNFFITFAEGAQIDYYTSLEIISECFQEAHEQCKALPRDPRAKTAFTRALVRNYNIQKGSQQLNKDEMSRLVKRIFNETLPQFSS
jgi:hypothetical protein